MNANLIGKDCESAQSIPSESQAYPNGEAHPHTYPHLDSEQTELTNRSDAAESDPTGCLPEESSETTSGPMITFLETALSIPFDDIEVVSFPFGAPRIAKHIHSAIFEFNIRSFIRKLKSGSISDKKLRKHIRKLNANPHRAAKEGFLVVKILSETADERKALYLANIYIALLDGRISFDQFEELCETLSRLFVQDVPTLELVYREKISSSRECEPFRISRMLSQGLLESGRAELYPGGDGHAPTPLNVWPSALGKLFCEAVLEE